MGLEADKIDEIINRVTNDLMRKVKEVSIVVNKKSPTSTTIRATYTDEDFRREATFTITVNQNEIICIDNNNEEGKIITLSYFEYWISKMLMTFVIESKILKLLEDHHIPLDTVSIGVDPQFEKAVAYIRLPNEIRIGIYFTASLEKLKITHVSIGLYPYNDEKEDRLLLSVLGSFIISLAIS